MQMRRRREKAVGGASRWAGLGVMATAGWAEPSPMATASLWAGLKVTIASRWAEPICMTTASLRAGPRVPMATLKGRS